MTDELKPIPSDGCECVHCQIHRVDTLRARVKVLEDAALIKLMLSACDGLEDLEDCMRESLNAIRPYLRTPPDKAATIEKMARAFICEYCGLLPKHVDAESISNFRNGIGDTAKGLNALLEAYEAEHE